MKRKTLIWAGAAGSVLFFVGMGWVLSLVMELSGGNRWLLRIGMLVLGAITGFIMHQLLSSSLSGGEDDGQERRRDRREGTATPDAVDEAFEEADRILGSGQVEGGKIGRRPAVLFLGPRGSTKTSVVEHSGLDLELLAGEVERDGEPVPTEAANLWLAGETVLVEAGGPVLEDDEAWSRLVGHLEPSRLGAALGQSRQPSRLAVVCLPCDTLRGAGGPDAVASSARRIRDRLRELSEQLGVRLPVYSLFTRGDQLPFFREFVEQITSEEARQVLGATLPLDRAQEAGAYADRESNRLHGEFDALFQSLALRRPELLQRESDRERKADIYEFPREFRKIRDEIVRFLVELGRPSQLSVTPFLRGFYFTGVRPVVHEEGTPPPSGAGTPGGGSEEVGATMAFDAEAAMAESPSPPDRTGRQRRVPQWVFLDRLFRRIFLGDEAAMAVTGSGQRVSVLRRALAGSGLALALTFLIGMTVSFFQNQGLADRVESAMTDLEDAPELAGVGPPSHTALSELDTLGRAVADLRSWETDGPPWRYRWFLYSGSDLLPPARRAFLERFRPVVDETRREIVDTLASFSDTAGTDYATAFDALKAFLVMTRESDRSDPDFMTPVLMDYWPHRVEVDEDRRELARAQFRVYARELAHGNYYTPDRRPELVDRIQAFLRDFRGVDRFYQAVVSSTSESDEIDAVRFDEVAPGSGRVLLVSHVVPGAYTQAGWEQVQWYFSHPDSLLANERWVTEVELTPEELDRLAAEAQQRYVSDYIDQWRQFLASAQLRGLSGVRPAADALESLSDIDSPLLQLVKVVARHTRVDSAVATAFNSVHAVAAPDSVDRFIVDANQKYVDALSALQSALDELASSSDGGDGGRKRAMDAARSVEGAVKQMSQDFLVVPEARAIQDALTSLLQAPGERMLGLLEARPARQMNARGREFCQALQPLESGYPFGDGPAVSVETVDAALKPGEGRVSSFYNDVLSELLVPDGSGGYRVASGASPRPTDDFVEFFNHLSSLSEAFYTDDGGPQVRFRLSLVATGSLPEVRFRVDGQTGVWTRTRSQTAGFRWVGKGARSAAIIGEVNGQQTTLVDPGDGTWSLFELFGAAEWEARGSGRYHLRWPAQGRPVPVEGTLLIPGTDAPIFDPSYLRFDCVPTVVR